MISKFTSPEHAKSILAKLFKERIKWQQAVRRGGWGSPTANYGPIAMLKDTKRQIAEANRYLRQQPKAPTTLTDFLFKNPERRHFLLKDPTDLNSGLID